MIPSHIIQIDGKQSGPKVGIQAITHGDEVSGKDALKVFEKKIREQGLSHGTLYLIEGNPEAYKQQCRCIQHNLNRLFSEKELSSDCSCYDHTRARELAPFLTTLDYHLDLHSTSKKSDPFVIIIEDDEAHETLARQLPGRFVTKGWKSAVQGSISEWVDSNGGLGIAIECGSHNCEQAPKVALEAIESFLSALQMWPKKSALRIQDTLQVIEHQLIQDHQSFQYSKNYENFQSLDPGELIASDQKQHYYAPEREDIVIIFPADEQSIRRGGNDDAYMIGQIHHTAS